MRPIHTKSLLTLAKMKMLESTRNRAALTPRNTESTLRCSLLTKHYGTHGHSPGHGRSPAPLCPQGPADLGCHPLMPHKASLPHKDWTWCLRENLLALSGIHTKPRGIKVRAEDKNLNTTLIWNTLPVSLGTTHCFLTGHIRNNSFFPICFQSEHNSEPVSSTPPLWAANLISSIASSAVG